MSTIPPRQPSTDRPPPMIPSGVPVRSAHARANLFQLPTQQQQLPHHQHHHRQQPSPRPPSHPSPRTKPAFKSSPAISSSEEGSLKESTRVNIAHRQAQHVPKRGESGYSDKLKSPIDQVLETPREQYTSQVEVQALSPRNDLEIQFENLLDSLQVPQTVRSKFTKVSPEVKIQILTSSLESNSTILSSLGLPIPNQTQQPPKMKKRMSTPLLRKAKSSSSIGSPGPNPQVGKTYAVGGDEFTIVASPGPLSSPTIPMHSGLPRPHTRASTDFPRHQSTVPRPLSMFSASGSASKGLGISMSGDREGPEAMIAWLKGYKGTDLTMDVGRMKKLRMCLRHENTGWVKGFLEGGGYGLVLGRLGEVLDVEWREEQHDDQMLYELLRCMKALTTSEVGKSALRSQLPNPFPALSKLLFSEKRPGDLAARQIIIELWIFLFDLLPPTDVVPLVRSLLLPPEEKKEGAIDHHEFISVAHRPRVFKALVTELGDICRDYFWIMCHGTNTLWWLDEVDERLVERPVAPGGATGGVEFEAMNYVITHFRLLNLLCSHQAKLDRVKASQLHQDLLSSGLDRILVTFRKASPVYYPNLHLELARYVNLLRSASANGRLPHLIDKLMGSPPDAFRKWTESGGLESGQASGGGRRGGWDGQA